MKFLATLEKYEEAITFAQAGEYKTAIEFINGKAGKAEKKQSEKENKIKLIDTLHDYQEAITFAEAGAHKEATATMDRIHEKKILVVGHNNTFSSNLTEYSLGMAKRLSYNIVALSSGQVDNNEKDSFVDKCKTNIELFKEMAKKSGVFFDHIIKTNNTEKAIEEVYREFRDIDFVVAEDNFDRRRECYVYALS